MATNANEGPADGVPYVAAGTDLLDLVSAPDYRGQIDVLKDGVIGGWCISTANPLQPVQLELWVGDEKLHSFVTSGARADIERAVGLPVRPEFVTHFHNSQTHSCADIAALLKVARDRNEAADEVVRVCVSGQPVELRRAPQLTASFEQLAEWLAAPVVVSALLPAPEGDLSFRGFVESIANGVIKGWCVNAARPNERLQLEVYYKNILMGVATTDESRDDINALMKRIAVSGFRFRPEDVGSTNASALLAALSKPSAGEDGRRDLMVRIAGANLILEFSRDCRFDDSDAARYAEAVTVKLAEISRNSKLDVLRALAKGPTPLAAGAPASVEDARDREDVGIVAFYLPQFHPFPENDEWWGTGFTEWTNVAAARPHFRDHNQPRIPADLGYYDLRLDAVHEQQVALARKYGVSAFCYHYYSFTGKTLMSLPVERHLANDYDLDFCLCWANENWSRRWDGSENEILIQQNHSESDDNNFIDEVIKYFGSRRYIKIDGAPLLLVYRVSLLSNPASTIRAWKRKVQAAGFPDLHVSLCESFGLDDPIAFGADSSCQFPPHTAISKEIQGGVFDLDKEFSGKIFDYVETAANETWRPEPPFLQFRTAMPSWDNTSRRGGTAHVFHNASPAVFEAWLSVLCAKAKRNPPGRRLVFVNAWNEWAEGAYLEPDRRDGHRNLRAVRAARSAANRLLGDALAAAPAGAEAGWVELVSSLANANRRLMEFATDYCAGPSMGPAPFVAVPKGAASQEAAEPSAFTVETVNGRPLVNREITMDASRKLALSGWVRAPQVVLTAELPVFVQLARAQGQKYVASIFNRFPRSDVAAFYGDNGEPHYGFNGAFDLRNVEPGVYDLQLLLGSIHHPNAGYFVSTRVTLVVG